MTNNLNKLKLRILNGVYVVLGRARAKADIESLQKSDEQVVRSAEHLIKLLRQRLVEAKEANDKARAEAKSMPQSTESMLRIKNPSEEILRTTKTKF